MDNSTFASSFSDFLTRSITPYHNISILRNLLLQHGFTEVFEKEFPDHLPTKGFFIRDGRALIAFNNPGADHVVVISGHNDSPVIKVRPIQPQDKGPLTTSTLDVMTYASGPLSYTFIDRDLKLAGAIFTSNGQQLTRHIIDTHDPIAFVPPPDVSKSITINSEHNQKPIWCLSENYVHFKDYLRTLLPSSAQDEEISSYDLSLIDCRPATIVGDLIFSGRIDDLGNTYPLIHGFLESNPENCTAVLAVVDSEEIGSFTQTGARSTLFQTILSKLALDAGKTEEELKANSLIVSADSAHGTHPNFEAGDKVVPTFSGQGLYIKYSTKGSYSITTYGAAIVQLAAERAGVPWVRSSTTNGRRGGGTIGLFTEMIQGLEVVDIGTTNLAMHSIRESMVWKEAEQLALAIKVLCSQFDDIWNKTHSK